jgi:hypothetical protein
MAAEKTGAMPAIAVKPSKGSLRDKANELHRQHERAGRKLTGTRLAEILDISDGYARRLLRELNADTMA